MKPIPRTIYHQHEFNAFINILEEGSAAHWVDIANAIGVDSDTITRWKDRPEAQAAIRRGIEHALVEMKKSGAKDWRMWEATLKMLGVNPVSKAEVELRSPIGEILSKYGLENGGANARKAKKT